MVAPVNVELNTIVSWTFIDAATGVIETETGVAPTAKFIVVAKAGE